MPKVTRKHKTKGSSGAKTSGSWSETRSLTRREYKDRKDHRRMKFKTQKAETRAGVQKSAMRTGAVSGVGVSATQQPGDTYVEYRNQEEEQNPNPPVTPPKPKPQGDDGDKEDQQQHGGIGW